MDRSAHSFSRLFAALLLALLASGCALGRSVVTVQAPTAGASDSKDYAKIIEVRDSRKFEIDPPKPSIPSLGEAADLSNPQITARAIARKRGGFGKAFGDVVLPEGSTVAGLVRSAAEKALQDKGYNVVDDKSPEYANAKALSVEIDQFWAWFTPGFVSVSVDFQSDVSLRGSELVGPDPQIASSHVHYETAAVFESTWADTVRRGVDDLVQRIEEKLRPSSR